MEGIPQQILNGFEGLPQQILNGMDSVMSRATERDNRIKSYYTTGLNKATARDIQLLRSGADLSGFAGDGSIADDEKLRNFLMRTRRVVRSFPASVEGYQKPNDFLGMIDYVLNGWDTPEREGRLNAVIEEEERLIGLGAINVDVAEDDEYEELDIDGIDDDDYEEIRSVNVDNGVGGFFSKLVGKTKKTKKGFFSKLKKATTNAALTNDAREIVASNPLTTKLKAAIRANAKRSRKLLKKRDSNGLPYAQNIAQTTVQATVNGIDGISSDTEDNTEAVLNGESLIGFGSQATIDEDVQLVKNYMSDLRAAIVAHPYRYCDEAKAHDVITAIDVILLNLCNNEAMNDAAIEKASAIAPQLGGWFKKIKKKVKKAVKKVAKTVKKVATAPIKTAVKVAKTAVKTAGKVAKTAVKTVKKVAKAVAKAVKKVVKFIIKFNPLSIMIRAGILVALKMNLFKLAQKAYPGILTEEERVKLGISDEDYDKSKKAYSKLNSMFVKSLGGKESSLKKNIKKGAAKKFSGSEEYDEGTFTEEYNNADADVQEYYTASEAELKSKGAEVTDDPNVMYSEEAKEVEVEVDDAQAANDATVSGLLSGGYFDGLGEAATAASAGAASGFIAKLVSFFKNIGVKALSFAKKAKTAVEKIKDNKTFQTATTIANGAKSLVSARAKGTTAQETAEDYTADNTAIDNSAPATRSNGTLETGTTATKSNTTMWIVGGIAAVALITTVILLKK